MPYKTRFYEEYLNPLQVEVEIKNLTERFPDLCRLYRLPLETHGYWGENPAAQGRQPMFVLRITSQEGPQVKPAVLLMRSHHAREWINGIAVVETARQLTENYLPDDPDLRIRRIVTLLNEVEFVIVPECNPDGARLSFFDAGRRMWRKNLRPPQEVACAGVDCNRNFPRYWGQTGSSSNPCSDAFRGPAPLSEPESANIRYLVNQFRNVIFAIDSHSYGQALFRPNPHGGRYISELPVSREDDEVYLHLERVMNRQIRLVQGIRYSTGTTSNHAGTTDEFLFFDCRIFAFDMECGSDFQPNIVRAVPAALEVAEATKALGWCAAGRTGLDIQALMRRREEVPVEKPSDRFADLAAAKPHALEAPLPEDWRRFYVAFPPLKTGAGANEALEMMEMEYDVIEQHPNRLRVIASMKELGALIRQGYKPVLERDLYSEPLHYE